MLFSFPFTSIHSQGLPLLLHYNIHFLSFLIFNEEPGQRFVYVEHPMHLSERHSPGSYLNYTTTTNSTYYHTLIGSISCVQGSVLRYFSVKFTFYWGSLKPLVMFIRAWEWVVNSLKSLLVPLKIY